MGTETSQTLDRGLQVLELLSAHPEGLNVTDMSCDGQMNFGAIACKEQMPDAWPLMRAIEDDIKLLLEACDA